MARNRIQWIGMIVFLLSWAIWVGSGNWRVATVLADDTPATELEGYLITDHSAKEHDEPSKINKDCIRMTECAASGYGISVKQAGGEFKFFKFDENGQKLAGEILAKTAKTNGIVVIAKGILEGDVLKVASLTEKAIQIPVTVELNGWLIDKCCSGTKDPVGHTTECLRMESCAATGFGILEKQKDGSFKFYKFDEKGHNLAKNFLKKITQKNNVTITVQGIRDGCILKVSNLSEKNKE